MQEKKMDNKVISHEIQGNIGIIVLFVKDNIGKYR